MIAIRTPLRASLAGGGTDLPRFYRKHGGAVLTVALDYHVDVVLRRPAAKTGYALACEGAEESPRLDAIRHPIVCRALQRRRVPPPLDIHIMSDVLSGTGLGSSSSLTVGLLHALHRMHDLPTSAAALAEEAFRLESEELQLPVGRQDACIAAFGGVQFLEFAPDDTFRATPLPCSRRMLDELQTAAMLVCLGGRRESRVILEPLRDQAEARTEALLSLKATAYRLRDLLLRDASLQEIGSLIDESWQTKRRLADGIASEQVDDVYRRARNSGALGGKLLGAGGTGFLFLIVPPHAQPAVQQELGLPALAFRIDGQGSRVLPLGA